MTPTGLIGSEREMDLKAQPGARKERVSLTYKQGSRRKQHIADNQYTVKQQVSSG